MKRPTWNSTDSAVTSATRPWFRRCSRVWATWLFSVVGLADFALAIGLSRFFNAGDFMGGAYWIPSFWVPMLIVGHVAVLQVLRQMQRTGASFAQPLLHA